VPMTFCGMPVPCIATGRAMSLLADRAQRIGQGNPSSHPKGHPAPERPQADPPAARQRDGRAIRPRRSADRDPSPQQQQPQVACGRRGSLLRFPAARHQRSPRL
jgi:hypothetical protein